MIIPRHIPPADWKGDTVAIVASGPSVATLRASDLAGKRVLAVAHGYKAVPNAPVLIVSGRSFFMINDLRADYQGELIVHTKDHGDWSWLPYTDSRMVYMERAEAVGLTSRREALAGSLSSVMLAINYAVHRGVKAIDLYGCDGQPGPDGQRRVGSAKKDSRNAFARYDQQEIVMATQVKPLWERGIRIINRSPGTRLVCYPTC